MKTRLIATAAALMMVSMLQINAQNRQNGTERTRGERPSPEQMFEYQAKHIAADLALSDELTSRFVETYKAFKSEQAAVMGIGKPVAHAEMTEDEVEAKILADFEKSRKILEIREKYYYEFRIFLNPRQIQKVYNAEKHSADHMRNAMDSRRQGNTADMHKGGQRPQGQRPAKPAAAVE